MPGCVAPEVAAAALLGRIHGCVRVREQRLGGRAVVRIHGDADAGRGVDVDGGDAHRSLQNIHHAGGQRRPHRRRPTTEVPISTNSSPPKRATVSAVRTTVPSRRATSCRSSSPARCPKESLMSLKRSRSQTSSAKDRMSRSACAMACCRRSSSRTRFGRPGQARRAWPDAAAADWPPPGPACASVITSSRRSTWSLTRRSFSHLRLSAVAHCRTSMGSAGLRRYQQLVGVAKPLHHLGPVVVGVCRTDDDLHVRIRRPQPLDGLEAVPTGRHAHVDERHRVRAAVARALAAPWPRLLRPDARNRSRSSAAPAEVAASPKRFASSTSSAACAECSAWAPRTLRKSK